MALEVLWSRTLAIVNGSSTYSFTIVLCTFLVGISCGSALAARFWGRTARPLLVLAGLFLFPEAPVIGAIPSGLPSLHLPTLGLQELPDILRFALVLAFLGSVDSLLTSLVADSMTRTSHDSNRELIGQGIGNMVGALIGGLPGAGATMRTVWRWIGRLRPCCTGRAGKKW